MSKVLAAQNRLRQKLSVRKGTKKICLTMIVKNESKNMPRLLATIKPVIDMISIVDTGSTDNTEEVIINWGKDNNIPTSVHHEPFQNFGYNRTHSVRIAKKTYPDADYFLLSDADFIWEVGDFERLLLIDHKYLVEQYNKHIRYWNVRLLSANVDWECVGVTHEFWQECGKQTSYAGEIRTGKIRTLVINDLEDGGAKGDKFKRDERLLLAGLADKNTKKDLKTRYKFYLAQTYKDVGRNEDAIKWYQERIDAGGWDEEKYYAMYQLGRCRERLAWHYHFLLSIIDKAEKNEYETKLCQEYTGTKEELTPKFTELFELAAKTYMDAYNFRKTRAESLNALATMHRLRSEHDKALTVAQLGKKLTYPSGDSLFIEPSCYDYAFDFEICICAYYVPGCKQLGREAITRLIVRDDLPDNIRKLVENNSRFYL